MIFIGVGSSIGNADKIFDSARAWLKGFDVNVVAESGRMKNPAIGGVAQNEFTNAVWQIEFPETRWEKANWVLLPQQRRWRLKAKKLLQRLRQCEAAHGRTTSECWADRPLDLDILQFHQLQVCRKKLHIPHPEIPKRIFVLRPWSEIVDENYHIPTFGRLRNLLQKLEK